MSFYRAERTLSAGDLIRLVGRPAELVGDASRLVEGVAALENAGPGALCFCSAEGDAARAVLARSGPGTVLVAGPFADAPVLATERTLIQVADPRRWFIHALNYMFPNAEGRPTGVSPQASIDPAAALEDGVSVGPFAVIEASVAVGRGCILHGGVQLLGGTRLGADVLVQGNTVIGATGLACEKERDGNHSIFPHLGGVVVTEGVRIGANTTVMRGTLRDTVIGAGSLIGSQVNIGHNAAIGCNCFISAGVMMAGSVSMGHNCWIAPGAVILNKVRLGERVTVGVGAVVTKDVADGGFVAGNPARPVPKLNRYNITQAESAPRR